MLVVAAVVVAADVAAALDVGLATKVTVDFGCSSCFFSSPATGLGLA